MSKTLQEYKAAREAMAYLATIRESERGGVSYCSISVYFGDAERAMTALVVWSRVAAAHRLSVTFMAFQPLGNGTDFELSMQVTHCKAEHCDTVAEAAGVGGPG